MYAISVDNFKKVNYNHVSGVKTVIVKSLEKVISLPCHQTRTSFKEDEEMAEGGKLYKPNVSGFIPNNTAEVSIQRELQRGRWLIVHQDAIGNLQLSGSVDNPLTYYGNKESGESGSASNGILFSFSGSTAYPTITVGSITEA